MIDPTNASGLVGNPRALPADTSGNTIYTAPSGGTNPRIPRMEAQVIPSTPSGTPSHIPVALRNPPKAYDERHSPDNLAKNAGSILSSRGATLSNQVPTIDGGAAGTNIDGNKFSMDAGGQAVTAETASVDTAANVTAPNSAQTYEADTTGDRVNDSLADAATMDTNTDALIDSRDIEGNVDGMATGTNEDGSTNNTGVALNDFAHQDISSVIDTSTISGKLLAQSLGEGNYVDSKSTVVGQLEILTKEFVGPNGEPKIPTWAAGIARNVGRTIAFKGVTGTAASSAMAQAMIEATLPIAQADSKFYQTMTIQNLDNKQQMVINKANVLSKMEFANLDMRTATAVTNAKTFIQYDMANLDNEQQTAIVNSQSKIQGILEDSKQVNVARRFGAEAANEMDMFYDNLSSSIDMYNTGQRNQMSQFNTAEVNSTAKFNADMENARETFYLNMQYQVDASNAKWRQTVTLTETDMEFQAAATDVKNILGLTSEALNQMWDRSDSLLDYAWQSGENSADRELQMEMAKMSAAADRAAAKDASKGSMWGAIGSAAAAAIIASDERLKDNIRPIGVLDNGVEIFQWEWNALAGEAGVDDQPTIGPIAQRLQKTHPDAVVEASDGYLRVIPARYTH